MTRAAALRLALAAAIAALCVAGFFACFEKRAVEVDTPVAAEARRNRHLALSRLLAQMGHAVTVHDDLSALDALPDPPATVFLTSNRNTLGPARSRALLDWVARGGHLVVQTFTVWEKDADGIDQIVNGKPDLLLDGFGLRQRQSAATKPAPAAAAASAGSAEQDADDEDLPEESEPEPATPPASIFDRETSWAYLAGGAELYELEFSSAFWWDDPEGVAVWSVAGAAGPHLLEIAHGDGHITALTSEEPLLNDSIGEADHAEFVVRWLRDGREARAPVWIFVNAEWPSLVALLRAHAWPALFAGGLLLTLWLWRSLFRFGPALPAPEPARRRWLEHLEAAGRFHWRQDRGAALLTALRAELARELARRRPAWTRVPEAERTLRLAQASGLAPGEVSHALFDAARTPRAFTAAVRALERIRAAL